MLMSYGQTFMTALTLLGIVISLNWPTVVQAGGGGERCTPTSCVFIDVEVEIEIKPGEDPREDPPSINPRSNGKIRVAVLTTGTFNAITADPDTVMFGPTSSLVGPIAAPVDWDLEDVNGDGRLDLLLRFRTQNIDIRCGDTSAVLMGEAFHVLLPDGRILIQRITGTDTFQTVGCQGK